MDMLAKSFRQSEGPVTGKDFKVQWMWDGGHRYAQVGAIEVVYHSGTLIFRSQRYISNFGRINFTLKFF